MIEFLLRLAVLLAVVALVVWDIRRERREPHPGTLGHPLRIRGRTRSGG